MMTLGNAYDVVVAVALLLTPIVLAAWWLERRQERQRRAAELARFRMSPAFRQMETAMTDLHRVVGTAIIGPFSQMAQAIKDGEWAFAPRGTVQNPSDPSPRPRRTDA